MKSITDNPIAEAAIRLEFWASAIMRMRAERRQIIELKEVSETRRQYLLMVNTDLTCAARKILSQHQHDHAELLQQSADRIAESVPVTVDHDTPTLSANDGTFDVYEGRGSEL